MQANYVQRLRLTFRKFGPTRYIGHLDLARALERSLNRAAIPVAYTQGFNRRPRMQFASPLPLGFISDCELADIWLTERVAPATAQEQIMSRMVPGIDIYDVTEVALDQPALQTLTRAASYLVTLLDPVEPAALADSVTALLASPSLLRERRGKAYDLRPLVLNLCLQAGEEGNPGLAMSLALLPGETGRPEAVLEALGIDPQMARISRTAIVLAEPAVEPPPLTTAATGD